MLTRQDAFDTALAGIRQQGRPSFGPKGFCAYRGEGGCRCAIGWLIPDDRYDPELETKLANHYLVMQALDADQMEYAFFSDMQRFLHDFPSREDVFYEPKLFLGKMEASARRFAILYDLIYTAPELVA